MRRPDPVKTLRDAYLEAFHRYGFFHVDRAIIVVWDPYASEDYYADKTYWIVTDAWMRIEPDGEVKLESFKRRLPIPGYVAEAYREMGTPLFHIQDTDIYEKKTQYLAKKTRVSIPKTLDVGGIVIKYGEPAFETLVLRAVEFFAPEFGGGLTLQQIVNVLTLKPPHGGGWLRETPENIRRIREAVEWLTRRGFLDYDEETGTYRPVTARIEATPIE